MQPAETFEENMLRQWAQEGTFPEAETIPDGEETVAVELALVLTREEMLMEWAAMEAFGDMITPEKP